MILFLFCSQHSSRSNAVHLMLSSHMVANSYYFDSSHKDEFPHSCPVWYCQTVAPQSNNFVFKLTKHVHTSEKNKNYNFHKTARISQNPLNPPQNMKWYNTTTAVHWNVKFSAREGILHCSIRDWDLKKQFALHILWLRTQWRRGRQTISKNRSNWYNGKLA